MIIRLSVLLVVLAGSRAESVDDRITVSVVDGEKYTVGKDTRYLLYDVNHGEGFNLRRDVYMRVAVAVKQMRERVGENIVLVLPPWTGMYHWRKTPRDTRLPWSRFFDVESLSRFVPVVEFEEFLRVTGNAPIDRVVYLQHYAEGWGDNYEMKSEKRSCIDGHKYYKQEKNGWRGWFFGLPEVTAREFECVSFQGDSRWLADLVARNYTDTSLMIDRAEVALHEHYGEREYWRARRSMRYAAKLEKIAARYRKEFLDSDDERDGTALPEDWEDEKERRTATGGPFVCAHWRRRDFVTAHGNNLPSIKGTGKQLTTLAALYNVKKVFLATDAPDTEIDELTAHVGAELHVFRPREEDELTDGEVAIVEQIICANARVFAGSHTSTFSFRIQEDREIRGLPLETTFNRMCPDSSHQACEQPAKWTIRY